MRYLALLTISVLLTFISTGAEARTGAEATEQPHKPGHYITLGVEFWQHDFCDDLEAALEDTFAVSCSQSATGLSFFGGYQFNNYVAIEYGYRSVSGFNLDLAANGIELNGDIEINTIDVGIRGSVPNRASAGSYYTWKVGIESWESEIEFSTDDIAGFDRASTSISTDDVDVYYGIGWGFNFAKFQGNQTNGLIIEYTQHSLGGDDFDALVVSWVLYL